MIRRMTCIICPKGCELTVTKTGDRLHICGNLCPRGAQYANNECTCPVRTVTSSLRVDNRCDTMISVKTSQPVKKSDVMCLMEMLKETKVYAPIQIGTVVLHDVFGADVVATKTVV